MRVRVSGVEKGGFVVERIVTPHQLEAVWGPWTEPVLRARIDRPLVVTEGTRHFIVWSELVR